MAHFTDLVPLDALLGDLFLLRSWRLARPRIGHVQHIRSALEGVALEKYDFDDVNKARRRGTRSSFS